MKTTAAIATLGLLLTACSAGPSSQQSANPLSVYIPTNAASSPISLRCVPRASGLG